MVWIIFKKFWREIIIAILVIVVAISVNTCSSTSAQKDADIELITNMADSAFNVARAYHLKNGELVHQVKTHEVTQSQFKKFGDKLIAENDNLKKQIGRANNLVGYWKVQATVKETIMIPGKDTTIYVNNNPQRAKVFRWTNKFLTLDQLYHPIDQTLSTTYSYNPSFQLTAYYKDRTFFKRGILVSDVKFDDPGIMVGQMKGIVIKQDPPRWYETKLAAFIFGGVVGSAGTIYVESKLK